MMKKLFIKMTCLALIAMQFACKEDKPTIPEPEFGTMTDIEGNVYKTIKIGEQIWMAENLRVEKFNDGSSIPIVELESTWSNPQLFDPMMCYYNNDKANKQLYGGLYNWYAVKTGKLAPKGWHIPNDSDWQKLMDYLIANGYNHDGGSSGNRIGKSLAATQGWNDDPTVGAVGNDQVSNNKTGFNAIPAGFRQDDGDYFYQGGATLYWSSSSTGDLSQSHFGLYYFEPQLYVAGADARFGFSVRCIKN